MAKVLATIAGTALRPGVSKNRRWYRPEVIAKTVADAQERIGTDGLPLTMLTHHGAEDSSDRIVGRVTSMTLAEDGAARFTADIADTPHGRTIASLIDTSDGKPAFLSGVSIRGAWTGKVRRENGPDGKGPVEAGDGLSLLGLDYTASPGVAGAAVDTFSWASDGQQETEERVLITESVQESTLTITEGVTYEGDPAPEPLPGGIREALAAFLGPVNEASLPGTVSMSKRKSGMTGGSRKYADPGYQSDKKQRYDITDRAHAIAAWRYINQASKASKYSAAQLKNIKARIRAALKSFGVKAAAEGWVIEPPYQVTEAVAEFYGDSSTAGSWSLTARNGPVNLSLSCYGMDPADMHQVLTAAAAAACDALAALDPDMDGDIDVPGHGDGDTDDDGGHETEPEPEDPAAENAPAEGAPAEQTSEAAAGPGETPATEREPDKETEAPVTTEATTNPGGSAPSITEADVQKAIAEALEADRKARKERKAAKKAKESAPAAPVAESAPAAQPDLKAQMAEVLESYGLKPPVTETEEERVQRLVQEQVRSFVQEAVSTGAVIPGRAGLQVREHAPTADEAVDVEGLAKMSDDQFAAYGGAALDKYMGDSTRHDALHT